MPRLLIFVPMRWSVVPAVALTAFVASAGDLHAQSEVSDSGEPTVERTVWTMGTSLVVRVDNAARGDAVSRLAEVAIREVESTEAAISSWRADSELSRISALPPGTRASPDPRIDALLDEVEVWRRRTHRAFDANLGALVDAWGLRTGGRIPTQPEIDSAVRATRVGVIRRVDGEIERTGAATWFDAGAFGKGYALRRAAEAVRASGVDAMVEFDFGGQYVRVSSGGHAPADAPTASTWLPVADPDHRGRVSVHVRVPDRPMVAVATSGNSERGVEVDGTAVGHVLDPRTGRPAEYAGTVTVIASDPMLADILSTALLVLGPEVGTRLARSLDDVDAVWQASSGAVVTTLSSDAWRLGLDGDGRSIGPDDSHALAGPAG